MKNIITTRIKEISNLEDLISMINDVSRIIPKGFGPQKPFEVKQVKKFLFDLNKDLLSETDFRNLLYKEFQIPKKSVGFRVIHAPEDRLKHLLKCIDYILRDVYTLHFRAYGFVNKRSIVDNAKIHVGKNYVYNIDLKDFFHSFDIQQVKWVFYNSILNSIENTMLRENLSYTLASLVTYTVNGKRTLPQGSPCSPSITNMLCYRLDKKLYRLAKQNGAEFSRYADDISFSSDHNIFKGSFISDLNSIIHEEKLQINPKKTRLQRANERQEVTGLTVNQDVNVSRKYIKEIRQVLYLCERYGIEKTQNLIRENRNKKKDDAEENKPLNLELFLKGKLHYLSMVKGMNNSTYLNLEDRFHNIFPNKITTVKSIIQTWQNFGIDEAIKKHLFWLKRKTKKIKNDFLDSYEPYDKERSFEINFKNLIGKKLYYEIKEKDLDKDDVSIIYYKYARQSKPWKDLLSGDPNDLQDEKRFIHLIYQLFAHNNCFNDDEWGSIFKYWKKNKEFLRADKFLFFALLINHEPITKGERLIVNELWMKEVGTNPNNKLTILEQINSNHHNTKKAEHNKNQLYHAPEVITKFLNKFKENTALKWTTHLWDNLKYNSIESFINEINEDKSYLSLFNHNRDLLNLIKYFIYTPTTPIENNIPQYGWSSKLSEMKFGWQFPNNLLIDWCKINYDNKDINSRKSPFKFIIPRELRPKNKVKGFEVKYFEDVVNVFKTEIQFRDNYLENEILKLQNRMKDFEFSGLESLRNLDFYTYTSAVLASIETILLMIRKYETANLVQFKSKIDAQYLNLTITQPNSFPSKLLNLENTKLFIGGELNAIAANLFSLADFSISTKFTTIDNQLIDGELKILHQESIAEWVNSSTINLVSNPIFEKNQSESTGFTYNITFKL